MKTHLSVRPTSQKNFRGDMMITIDKGIPMPQKTRKNKYPWELMEVGDSFLIKDYGINKATGQACNMCTHPNKKYTDKSFEQRLMPNGLRIWRVK